MLRVLEVCALFIENVVLFEFEERVVNVLSTLVVSIVDFAENVLGCKNSLNSEFQ